MSHMFHHHRYSFAGLIALLSFPAVAQLNVYPDRFSITESETIQLTIEVDQRTSTRPDFSPLTKDFHFLGSKQMTVSSYANGANQNTTRWKILLRPRRAGDLQIPALQLNNEFSQPQLISVEGNTGSAALISHDAYLESSVDSYEIYQNSQLLYSIRLFHLNDLPPMSSLSEPVISGTKVVPLGETQQYSREMKGETYQVTEQSYALFPEQPGELTVPAAHFSAGPGTPELKTSPVTIDVLPRVSQKIRGYWLPASKVTLEDLTIDKNTLTLGDSQIRILKVSADGLTADQLPALMPLRNELAKISVEDVSFEQKTTPRGVTSSRTETVRITPAERGEVTLPEIVIPWWNINLDKSEKASLPKIILRVEPAAPEIAVDETPVKAIAETENKIVKEEPNNGNIRLLIWLLTAIAVISSLGWLYSYSAQRRKKFDIGDLSEKPDMLSPALSENYNGNKSPQGSSDSSKGRLNPMLENEQKAFSKAIEACYNDHPLEARLFILEWARLFWPHNQFNDSLDLSDLNKSKTLELLLMDMESYISGAEPGPWSGDLLAKALEHIRDYQLQETEQA